MSKLDELVEWAEKQDSYGGIPKSDVIAKARALLAAEQKPTADKGVGSLLSWIDNEPEKVNKTLLKHKIVLSLAHHTPAHTEEKANDTAGFNCHSISETTEGLEKLRKQLCGYGPNAKFCDCKYGATRQGEETGCPELRSAIWHLSRHTAATTEEPLACLADRKGMYIWAISHDKVWHVSVCPLGSLDAMEDTKHFHTDMGSNTYAAAEQAARRYLTALPDKVAEKKGGE